jgi:hypothetical protein
MTNVEMVKASLKKIKNVDGGISLDDLFSAVNGSHDVTPLLTRKQISATIKSIKSLVRVGDGIYHLKGRYAKPLDK